MKNKGAVVLKKLLYTVINDAVLFGLLILLYFLIRGIGEIAPPLIAGSIILFFALAVFYVYHASVVSGSRFDDDDKLYTIYSVKTVFAYLNLGVCLVFSFMLPPPVVALPLIGINVILFSWRQYYRIILILTGKVSCHEGRVLSVRKEVQGTHVAGIPPLYAHYYVAHFELQNGKVVPLCVDNFSRLRIDNDKDATLVWFDLPKGRKYGEIFIK